MKFQFKNFTNNTIFLSGLNRLFIALGLFLISIAIGMTGFIFIENYGFLNAFYMTVITLGTVGFTEVHALSPNGRIFTAFYILMNLGIFAFSVSVITHYFFEGELKDIFAKLKIRNKASRMENHVIVCGFGRNGSKAFEELLESNYDLVILEKERAILEKNLGDKINNATYFIADATEDNVLIDAGITKASAIIISLPSDADNVFISLTARELNPNIRIIARASDESAEGKLKRAGADYVVVPERIGGIHMAKYVTGPEVIEFMELIEGNENTKLKIEEVAHEQLKLEYKNKTIKQLKVRENTGAMVIAIRDSKKGFLVNPSDKYKIIEKDVFILLGTEKQIDKFLGNYCSGN
ncbi:MAG: potassium channel protein [Bacteroidota bacterium]|nr:potassium channel protein [Bacteroidota bacterium]